jgi:hypothetical protein
MRIIALKPEAKHIKPHEVISKVYIKKSLGPIVPTLQPSKFLDKILMQLESLNQSSRNLVCKHVTGNLNEAHHKSSSVVPKSQPLKIAEAMPLILLLE